jgi:hypothetical protein
MGAQIYHLMCLNWFDGGAAEAQRPTKLAIWMECVRQSASHHCASYHQIMESTIIQN